MTLLALLTLSIFLKVVQREVSVKMTKNRAVQPEELYILQESVKSVNNVTTNFELGGKKRSGYLEI